MRFKLYEIKTEMVLLRSNQGDFSKDTCDYRSVWSAATDYFLLVNCPALQTMASENRTANDNIRYEKNDEAPAQYTSGRTAHRESNISQVKNTPSGQVVPRTNEFNSISALIRC